MDEGEVSKDPVGNSFIIVVHPRRFIVAFGVEREIVVYQVWDRSLTMEKWMSGNIYVWLTLGRDSGVESLR